MIPARLKFLAQWRRPLARWRRGRLWQLYDQAYDPLVGHTALHLDWIAKHLGDWRPQSVFSVGPGRAELELALCSEYDCEFGYAETYSRYCRTLERRFRRANLARNIVQRHQGGFQAFQPTRGYDLILAIHSWYAFGQDGSQLRKALGMLSDGGSFLLTVTCDDDFFFQNEVRQQVFSAQQLSQWSNDLGLDHEFHLLRLPVAAHDLIVDEELTEEARGIASFLRARLWRDFSASEKADFQEDIMEAIAGAGVERRYGLLHFRGGDPSIRDSGIKG